MTDDEEPEYVTTHAGRCTCCGFAATEPCSCAGRMTEGRCAACWDQLVDATVNDLLKGE